MLERFRQSLVLRLALLYALLFALASAAIFAVLYWSLGRSIEAREQRAVEARAESFAQAYAQGGVQALRLRMDSDPSPEVRSLIVRIVGSDGVNTFAKVPTSWVKPEGVLQFVPAGWMGWRAQEVHSVRIPQDATRDSAVASRSLSDGHLLQVASSTDSRAVLLAPLRLVFAKVGSAALLLSLMVGTMLAWRATRPLREVAATARRIVVEDDLTARVPALRGSGELALLARQLNTLLDKNAEHVRVLRETLDNLAHDLRTPLTRLRGDAELALQDGGDAREARHALVGVVDESDRVLHLLEALLDVSAAEAGAFALRREAVDLNALVVRSVDLYSEVAEARNISLSLKGDEEQGGARPAGALIVPAAPAEASASVPGSRAPPILIAADPIRLGQALSNLVDNALKYTPEGGQVTVTVSATPVPAVTIDDSGPGVPPSEREAIWRRLYRSDSSRSQRGLGLGLTLVRAIAEAHGGTATVGDSPLGGARFELRLPAQQ
jgi:signal transduction histidine kinase